MKLTLFLKLVYGKNQLLLVNFAFLEVFFCSTYHFTVVMKHYFILFICRMNSWGLKIPSINIPTTTYSFWVDSWVAKW